MAKRRDTYIFAPVQEKRRGPGCLWLLLSLVIAAAVLTAVINTSMNKRVRLMTEKVPVMSLEKDFERFTVLHISDLHAAASGMDAALWEELLKGKTFSAVMMTGDMVGGGDDVEPMLTLIATLKKINSNAPVFFIAGDDDPPPVVNVSGGNPNALNDWVLAAQRAGAVYLDAPQSVPCGRRKVWFVPEYLYGVDCEDMLYSLIKQKEDMEKASAQYDAAGGVTYRALGYRIDAAERSIAAIKEIADTDMQIALTHVPLDTDYIRTMLTWADTDSVFSFKRLSLVAAGHYAGGQWVLPGGLALYVPERGFFVPQSEISGMRRVNSISQYISVGLGASDYYPLAGRLLNSPGVTLLTFTARIE